MKTALDRQLCLTVLKSLAETSFELISETTRLNSNLCDETILAEDYKYQMSEHIHNRLALAVDSSYRVALFLTKMSDSISIEPRGRPKKK